RSCASPADARAEPRELFVGDDAALVQLGQVAERRLRVGRPAARRPGLQHPAPELTTAEPAVDVVGVAGYRRRPHHAAEQRHAAILPAERYAAAVLLRRVAGIIA